MTTSLISDTVECRHCFRTLPKSEFRRDRGRIRKECRDCRRDYQRAWRERRRDRLLEKSIGPLSWRSARQNDTFRVIERLVDKCGGEANLAESWHQAIRRAQRTGDHRMILRSMQVIVDLIARHQTVQAASVDRMDEKSLREFIRGEAVTIISERPEILFAVADELGWFVQPPDQVFDAAGSGLTTKSKQ